MATIDRHATVPLLCGVALGIVDFAAQKLLPYPWANLANSSAVWAVLAFAMAYALRGSVLRSVVGAIVMLVVAVPAYYLTATAVQDDALSNVWATTALLWMFFGVLAGAVFGVAAAWARDGAVAPDSAGARDHVSVAHGTAVPDGAGARAGGPGPDGARAQVPDGAVARDGGWRDKWVRGGWRGVVGVALPAAVLLAEAARLARRDETATAVIEAVLAVVVLILAGRTWRRRGLGGAVAVPLALLGFAGFQVAGFA
ncbi:DUF6518 family protein [Actinoplanes sp. NPDC049316]|uniref:DUF6518 family protein n=1 Tax=Actinoplanes sp. NPDC049316 TaxID=3154727 RepID=UPI003417DC13